MAVPVKPHTTARSALRSACMWHVFKCGGTSFKSLFSHYDNLHCTNYGGFLNSTTGDTNWEYGWYDRSAFDFTFAVIRHPVARVESIWRVMDSRRTEGCSMDWVLQVAQLPGVPFRRNRGIASDHEIWTHTRPYAPILGRVDRVYLLERIEEWWPELSSELGVDGPLPKANVSPKHNSVSMFDRDRIKSLYSEDLSEWESRNA